MNRSIQYKVWKRWKSDRRNTNEIAKGLDLTEPEVDQMIMDRLNRDGGAPARFAVA